MVSYEVRESARARGVRVTVYLDGRVVLTKPKRISLAKAERLLHARHAWIEEAKAKMARMREKAAKHPKTELPSLRRGTKAYRAAFKEAQALLVERVRHFANAHGFHHGTIRVRNQKSRWGSCTKGGNLSFNVRLLYLPAELRDYVVVHELAHTVEHNHSVRFWSLVRSIMPECMAYRKRLQSYRF